MKQRITEKITTKQYEKSSEMYLKIISQSTPPTLQYILPVVGCVVARCSTLILAKSPANCDAHLAESLFQTLSGMYQKNIFAIRTPYFMVYIPEFGCHSSLRQPHPHPGQSPTNCDVHLVESFFNMLWKYRKNRKSIINYYYKNKKTSGLYYTISKLFILL